MLPHFAQFSPQGLMPQFSGLQAGPQAGFQAIGSPLMEPYPFAGQPNSFAQNPFAPNPFMQSPPGSFAPVGPSALSQIVPALGQLAQQVAVQSVVTQQIGVALHQLAQHLAIQGLQGQQGLGLNAGQAFGAGGQFGYGGFNPQAQQWAPQWTSPQAQAWAPQWTGPQAQPWGSPQTPAWGANRSQTIQ